MRDLVFQKDLYSSTGKWFRSSEDVSKRHASPAAPQCGLAERKSNDEGQQEVFEIWRSQSHSFLDMLERSCVGEGEVMAVHHTKKALAKT